MLAPKFAERYESFLGWIAPSHRVFGSTGTGRITDANPRDGLRRRSSDGLYYHPVVVADLSPTDKLFTTETFGPIIGVMPYRTLDEAIDAGQPARLRPVVVDLHHRSRRPRSRSGRASAPAWSR